MRNAIIFSLLARLAASQSITEVIAATPELAALGTVLELVPDLVETLSGLTDITVLAPNSEALQAVLDEAGTNPDIITQVPNILRYHVVGGGAFRSTDFSDTPTFAATLLDDPDVTGVTGGQVVKIVAEGGGVMANTANVVTADVEFDGGIVHIIDEVLTIPPSIPDAAAAAGLTALAEAATAAGVLEDLTAATDVTLFAPNNEAFEAVADVTADLTPEELANILNYHVVVGTVGYSTTLETTSIETAQGSSVNITVSDSGVMVNDANVVLADVLVANGVVHVIDGVLIPPTDGGNGGDPDPTETETTTGPASPTATVNNAPSGMPSKIVTFTAGLLTFAMVFYSL